MAVSLTCVEMLKTRLLSDEAMRPFQCEFCKWSFKQNVHLKRHMENVHKDGKSTVRDSYECVECSKRYTSMKKLVFHEADAHQHPNGLVCRFCDRRHADMDGLMRHYEFAHSSLLAANDEIKVKDPIRNQDALSEMTKMDKHLTTQMKVLVDLACMDCSERFTDLENFLQHTVRAHLTVPTCIKCGKVYAHMSAARKHLMLVQCSMFRKELERAGIVLSTLAPMASITTCDICNFSFRSKTKLDIHKRKHSGEKPFRCDECGKEFAQKNNWKSHIETIHEGKKKPVKISNFSKKLHLCPVCSKTFPSGKSLEAHLRIHSGTRPFTCDHCGRGFTQKGNLNIHVRRWHMSEPKKPQLDPATFRLTKPPSPGRLSNTSHFKIDQIKADDPEQSQFPNYIFTKFNTKAKVTPSKVKTKAKASSSDPMISTVSLSDSNVDMPTTIGVENVMRYFQQFSVVSSTATELPSVTSMLNNYNSQIGNKDFTSIIEKEGVVFQDDTTPKTSLMQELPGNLMSDVSSLSKVVKDEGDLESISSSIENTNRLPGVIDSLDTNGNVPMDEDINKTPLLRQEFQASLETSYDPFGDDAIHPRKYVEEESNSLNCQEVNVISYLTTAFESNSEMSNALKENNVSRTSEIQLCNNQVIRHTDDSGINKAMCRETNVITQINQHQYEDYSLMEECSNFTVDTRHDTETGVFGMETNVIRILSKSGEINLNNVFSNSSDLSTIKSTPVNNQGKGSNNELIVLSPSKDVGFDILSDDPSIRNSSFLCKETNVIKGILSAFEAPSFAEDSDDDMDDDLYQETTVTDSPITLMTRYSREDDDLETCEIFHDNSVITELPMKFEAVDGCTMEEEEDEQIDSADLSPKCLETNVITALGLIGVEYDMPMRPQQTYYFDSSLSKTKTNTDDRSLVGKGACHVTNVITGVSGQLAASEIDVTQTHFKQTNVIKDAKTLYKNVAEQINVDFQMTSSKNQFTIESNPIATQTLNMSSSLSAYGDDNQLYSSLETTPCFENIEKELNPDDGITSEPVFYLLEQNDIANLNSICPSLFPATPTISAAKTQVIVNSNLVNENFFLSSDFFLEDSNDMKTDDDLSDCVKSFENEADKEAVSWTHNYQLPLMTNNSSGFSSSTVIKNITGGEIKNV